MQRGLKIIRDSAHAAPPNLRPDLNLDLDLGFDSMQRVELLSRLEEEFAGNVAESQLTEIYTVRDLVDAVLKSAANGAGARPHATFAGWKAILLEDPQDPDVLALANPNRINDTFWFLFSRVLQLVALDRFHLKVTGLEKLPKTGGYILSSNHQSFLDPLILASVLPSDVFFRAFALGTSDHFGKGLMRRLARSIKIMVLDPDANLVPAMRAGAFGLRHGMALVLYPEGERSIDGMPRIFKKGAAIYEVWPRSQKFRGFAPLKMVFGDPIYPPPESEASEEAYTKLTADLKARVVAMWEQLRASK